MTGAFTRSELCLCGAQVTFWVVLANASGLKRAERRLSYLVSVHGNAAHGGRARGVCVPVYDLAWQLFVNGLGSFHTQRAHLITVWTGPHLAKAMMFVIAGCPHWQGHSRLLFQEQTIRQILQKFPHYFQIESLRWKFSTRY